MEAYATWIEAYVARQPHRFVRGHCYEATEEMVVAFPELKRVAGFVYSTFGREQHFWCVTPDGTVVDPTKSQFQLVFNYEELDLSNPEVVAGIPTGVCAQCGEDTYRGDTCCSRGCELRYLAYVNNPEQY
jgi:hypothetical protein